MAREVEELKATRAVLAKRLEEVEREASTWKERYNKLKNEDDEQRVPHND